MLCDKCRSREANVHVTQIVNGVKYEQNLCAECARAQTGALVSMAGNTGQLERIMNFFRNIGMVGVVVAPEMSRATVLDQEVDLEALGLNLPGTAGASGGVDVGSLKAELNAAVAREDFEKAAELRDEIYRLEH